MEPKAAATPEKVADYRVIRRIATGGTSDVLLARAEGPHGFERVVVLKLLLAHHRQDPTFERLFAGEAAAYARLAHPAIVRLFDFLSDEGQLVLVLEYVDGMPLNKLRTLLKPRGEELDDRASLYVASRIFSALGAAHAVKDDAGEPTPVVHRDVNPSNVLIPWDGHAKLADFGIAKVTGTPGDTKAGLIKGTFGYMAPEQAMGKPVSPRTDVYAASLVLWELLTRRRAIQRANMPEAEVLQAMAKPHLPSLDVLRPTLPKPLRDALRSGLEPNPDRRVITAEEFYAVIRSSTNLDDGRGALASAMAKIRPAPVADWLAITVSRAPEPSWASRPLDGADDTMMGNLKQAQDDAAAATASANGVAGLGPMRDKQVSSLAALLEPDTAVLIADHEAVRLPPTLPPTLTTSNAPNPAWAVPEAPVTVPADSLLASKTPPPRAPPPPRTILSKNTLDGGFAAPVIAAAVAAAKAAQAAQAAQSAQASTPSPSSSASARGAPQLTNVSTVGPVTEHSPLPEPILVDSPPALFQPQDPDIAAAMAQEAQPARAAYRPWLSSNSQSSSQSQSQSPNGPPSSSRRPPPPSTAAGPASSASGYSSFLGTPPASAAQQSSYSSLLGGGGGGGGRDGHTASAPAMVRPREPQLTPDPGATPPIPILRAGQPRGSDDPSLAPSFHHPQGAAMAPHLASPQAGFAPAGPLPAQFTPPAALQPQSPLFGGQTLPIEQMTATPPVPQPPAPFFATPGPPRAELLNPNGGFPPGAGFSPEEPFPGEVEARAADAKARAKAGLYVGVGVGALVLLVGGAFAWKIASSSGAPPQARVEAAASAAEAPAAVVEAPPKSTDAPAASAAAKGAKAPPASKAAASAVSAASAAPTTKAVPTPPAPPPAVAPPPPTKAPPPVAAKPPPSSPKATTGTVNLPVAAKGHRVFSDGKLAGHDNAPLTLSCGKHAIKIGSGGKPQNIDVPCGGEVTIK